MHRTSGFAAVLVGASLPGLWGRNHYMRPHFDEGEGGDGMGGDGGDGGDGGGGDGGDGGEIQAHEFKDLKGYVKLPGYDKPLKLSDLDAALKGRTQYEGGLKVMGQLAAALRQEKEAAGKGGQQNRGGQGGQGGGQRSTPAQRQEAKDILAELEGQEILDGKSIAGVLRHIESNTITPLVQAVLAIGKQMNEMKGHVGRSVQREAEGDLGNDISRVVQALKLPTVGGMGVEGADIVNEMIRDFFFSYDDADQPKLRQGDTLQKLFSERFTKMRTFFRSLEKQELEAARERQRQQRFVRPGAGSSANGKPRRMLRNDEVAAALFQGQSQEA